MNNIQSIATHTMTEQQMQEFMELTAPLIKFLNDNIGPHSMITITPTNATLFEGQVTTGEVLEFTKD